VLGLLVAPAPRPEFEALGSNFLEDKVSRNVSPFLVRGAVRAAGTRHLVGATSPIAPTLPGRPSVWPDHQPAA
jgi:hypothetical protein